MDSAMPDLAVWDLRLPPESFYWALLDVTCLPRRARSRGVELGYLFESFLPVAIEDVHAVYEPVDDGRMLACGLAMHRVAELSASGPMRLGPTCVPEFLSMNGEVSGINLLQGRFEPSALRRQRARITAFCCAAAFACGAAIIVGQFRRMASFDDRVRVFAGATAIVYDQVLPGDARTLPPAARLTAELRTLDRTRAAPLAAGPVDITPTLASLLASWPAGLQSRTETLSVGPDGISLTVRLPDASAAQRFERELTVPQGWRLTQPSVQAERDGILFRARMEASS